MSMLLEFICGAFLLPIATVLCLSWLSYNFCQYKIRQIEKEEQRNGK